jgi:hypothetical protein
MTWYWWMILGAALALGGTYYLTGSLQAIKPKAPETCAWCSRVSGHTVTGHSYQACRGPADAQLTEERRRSSAQAARQRRSQEAEHLAAATATERARQDSRARILQVGTITTRTSPRGNEIHVSGWVFDSLTGPYSGPSKGSPQPFSGPGAPEKWCGWTVLELHAIAHGGGCRCDVVRLAQHV